MIKNYVTIAWRNLLRNKVFSAINIFGLAIGMAACFLIMQYVRFELSYDRFHQNSERIYRVLTAGSVLSAANHPGTGPAMKSEPAFPGNPFEFFFLDDYFDRQYAADQQFGRVFGLFSGLALIVAALGLFGLSTFMISQRTKEIAVRKVLGATVSGMIALFSRDFVRLVIVANLIALPAVYFLVGRWLESFAFRIDIGWIIFIVPPVVLLVISLVTVSVHTVRAGWSNPVKSLRSE